MTIGELKDILDHEEDNDKEVEIVVKSTKIFFEVDGWYANSTEDTFRFTAWGRGELIAPQGSTGK